MCKVFTDANHADIWNNRNSPNRKKKQFSKYMVTAIVYQIAKVLQIK